MIVSFRGRRRAGWSRRATRPRRPRGPGRGPRRAARRGTGRGTTRRRRTRGRARSARRRARAVSRAGGRRAAASSRPWRGRRARTRRRRGAACRSRRGRSLPPSRGAPPRAPARFRGGRRGHPAAAARRCRRPASPGGGARPRRARARTRGCREFGLERAGVARLLLVMQVFDIAALLPLGVLADRRGTGRVLVAVLLVMAGASALVGFGTLPLVAAGCALYGLSMAGWMLPLGVLRHETPPEHVAWRTGLYRVCVDGGLFLGPFLAGLLGAGRARVLAGVWAVSLAVTSLPFFIRER